MEGNNYLAVLGALETVCPRRLILGVKGPPPLRTSLLANAVLRLDCIETAVVVILFAFVFQVLPGSPAPTRKRETKRDTGNIVSVKGYSGECASR